MQGYFPRMKKVVVILLFLLSFNVSVFASNSGWSFVFPTIGAGNGFWRLSVGLHFWDEYLRFRNLQLQADVDLGRGLRWHGVLRSNGDVDGLSDWAPRFDENYLEFYGFGLSEDSNLSFSLKIGRTMYLRFPYPDAIALFDFVPSIRDLREGGYGGYSGFIFTIEYAHKSGFGFHSTWISWGFGADGPDGWIENYAFFRKNIGDLHMEVRCGRLPIRAEPLGRSAQGWSVFLGLPIKDYSIGFLYENLEGQRAYTGLAVRLPVSDLAKRRGEVAFDYTKDPEGFTMQVPLAVGTIGRVKRLSKVGDISLGSVLRGEDFDSSLKGIWLLVGELIAERVMIYGLDGQTRSFYEHRLYSWGDTLSKNLLVIMEEEPWYLDTTASVSPNAKFGDWDDFKKWERERFATKQLKQKVVYKFYRKREGL